MLAERKVVRLARDKIGVGFGGAECGKTNHYKAKLGKTNQNQAKPMKTRNPLLSDPLFNRSYKRIYI